MSAHHRRPRPGHPRPQVPYEAHWQPPHGPPGRLVYGPGPVLFPPAQHFHPPQYLIPSPPLQQPWPLHPVHHDEPAHAAASPHLQTLQGSPLLPISQPPPPPPERQPEPKPAGEAADEPAAEAAVEQPPGTDLHASPAGQPDATATAEAVTSKPTETMLVSQAPPEHGPEPGTTAEAASQGTAAEARKPEASPVFSFKSPQSSSAMTIGRNPGIVKNLKKRPGQSKSGKSAKSGSTGPAPAELAATAGLVSPLSNPIASGTSSADNGPPPKLPASAAEEQEQPERRRRDKSRWGQGPASATPEPASQPAIDPAGRGHAAGRDIRTGSPAPVQRASAEPANEQGGQHAARVPSEDGEVASPGHAPRSRSRSQQPRPAQPEPRVAESQQASRHSRDDAARGRSSERARDWPRDRQLDRDRDSDRHRGREWDRGHSRGHSRGRANDRPAHAHDPGYAHREHYPPRPDWDRSHPPHDDHRPQYQRPYHEAMHPRGSRLAARYSDRDRPPSEQQHDQRRHEDSHRGQWRQHQGSAHPRDAWRPDHEPADPYGDPRQHSRSSAEHDWQRRRSLTPLDVRRGARTSVGRRSLSATHSPEPGQQRYSRSVTPHALRQASREPGRQQQRGSSSRSQTPAPSNAERPGRQSLSHSMSVSAEPDSPVYRPVSAGASPAPLAAAPEPDNRGGWVVVRQPSAEEGRPIEAPPAPKHGEDDDDDDALVRGQNAFGPTSPASAAEDLWDVGGRLGGRTSMQSRLKRDPSPAAASNPASPLSPSVQRPAPRTPAADARAKRRELWNSRYKAGTTPASDPPVKPEPGIDVQPKEEVMQPPPPPPLPPQGLQAAAPPARLEQAQILRSRTAHAPVPAPLPPWQLDYGPGSHAPFVPPGSMHSPQYLATGAVASPGREQLRGEMLALQSHVEAMFLGSLPISHAVIPNFPVAGDPSEALTSQQRAAAYQAQLEWHAPSLVKHGPEADFTTNWDGDRHDPTRYPIAAGLYMGPLPPEEADTRQVLQDDSHAAPIVAVVNSAIRIHQGDFAPVYSDSRELLGRPHPDPRLAQPALPAATSVRLPVPKIAWGWPRGQEAASEAWDSVTVSWSDSPRRGRGQEAQSRLDPPQAPQRLVTSASQPAAHASQATGAGSPAEPASPAIVVAEGTSPPALPNAELQCWWQVACEQSKQAQGLHSLSPITPGTLAAAALLERTPVDEDATERAFWNLSVSAPAEAQIAQPAGPSAAAAGPNAQAVPPPAAAAAAATAEPPPKRRRRRWSERPTAEAVESAKRLVCQELIAEWARKASKVHASTLVQQAFEASYDPWLRNREEQRTRAERLADEQAAKEERMQKDRQRKEEEQRQAERKAAQAAAEAAAKAKAQSKVHRIGLPRREEGGLLNGAQTAARGQLLTRKRQAEPQRPAEQQDVPGRMAKRRRPSPTPPSSPASEPVISSDDDAGAEPGGGQQRHMSPRAQESQHQPERRQSAKDVQPQQGMLEQGEIQAEQQQQQQQQDQPQPEPVQPHAVHQATPLSRRASKTVSRKTPARVRTAEPLDDDTADTDEEYEPSSSKQRGRSRAAVRKMPSLSRGRSSGGSAKRSRAADGDNGHAHGHEAPAQDAAMPDGPAMLLQHPGQLDDAMQPVEAEEGSDDEDAAAERKKQEAIRRHAILEVFDEVITHMEQYEVKHPGEYSFTNPKFADLEGAHHKTPYLTAIKNPMSLVSMRKRCPTIENLLRKPQPSKYDMSILGLAAFRDHFELIVANCVQYWSVELDMAQKASSPNENHIAWVQALLQYASEFKQESEKALQSSSSKHGLKLT